MWKLRGNKRKRYIIVFFFIAISLMIGFLFIQQAMQSTSVSEEPLKQEPVVLTIFGALTDPSLLTSAFQDDEVILELQRRTGVLLDFTPDLNVTDHSLKLSVMLANKQLPDIVVLQSAADRAKVLHAKAAEPLNEWVQRDGADIAANASQALEHARLYRSDGSGELYFLPGGVGEVQLSPITSEAGWQIRWDLYRQLGYPALKDLDDLLNVLEQMQQIEPVNRERKKTYGLGLHLSEETGLLDIDRTIASQLGYVQTTWNDAYVHMETGEVVPRISDPDSIFWQAMAFYNRAYQRGILDPESATMMRSASLAKHKAGLYMAAPSFSMLGGADRVFLSNGDIEKGFVPLLIGHNQQHIFAGSTSENGNIYDIFISRSSPNVEAAMKFLNDLYSYEGMELLLNGLSSRHYRRVNGLPIISEEEMVEKRENPNYSQDTGIGKYNRLIRFSPPLDESGIPTRYEFIPENMSRLLTPVQRQYIAYYEFETVTEPFTRIPTHTYDISWLSSLSANSGSGIQALQQQLDTYMVTHIAKIMFQPTEEQFQMEKQKFVEAYRSKGSEEVFRDFKQKYE